MLFPGSQPFSIAAPQPPLLLFYQSWRIYSLPTRKYHYNICCFFFFSLPSHSHFCFLLTPVAYREELSTQPCPLIPSLLAKQLPQAHLKHGPVNKQFDLSLAVHLPPAWFASLDLRVQMFPLPSSCLLRSRDNSLPGRKPLGLISNVDNAFWMQSSSCKVSRQQQRTCLIALIRTVKENIKRTKRTFAKISYENLRGGHCLPCAKIPLPALCREIFAGSLEFCFACF